MSISGTLPIIGARTLGHIQVRRVSSCVTEFAVKIINGVPTIRCKAADLLSSWFDVVEGTLLFIGAAESKHAVWRWASLVYL